MKRPDNGEVFTPNEEERHNFLYLLHHLIPQSVLARFDNQVSILDGSSTQVVSVSRFHIIIAQVLRRKSLGQAHSTGAPAGAGEVPSDEDLSWDKTASDWEKDFAYLAKETDDAIRSNFTLYHHLVCVAVHPYAIAIGALASLHAAITEVYLAFAWPNQGYNLGYATGPASFALLVRRRTI